MRKLKLLAFALICAVFAPAKADEGMWLLQLMQEQNLADRMKAQGLKIGVDDIYSPNHVALKDAVGIFGRGCTGEIQIIIVDTMLSSSIARWSMIT